MKIKGQAVRELQAPRSISLMPYHLPIAQYDLYKAIKPLQASEINLSDLNYRHAPDAMHINLILQSALFLQLYKDMRQNIGFIYPAKSLCKERWI